MLQTALSQGLMRNQIITVGSNNLVRRHVKVDVKNCLRA